MTRKVEVDADDLRQVLKGGIGIFDNCDKPPCAAARRLRAALTPPQPTLRDVLARIVGEACGYVSLCWNPAPTGAFDPTRAEAAVDEALVELLPVVEAAVSEAADEAWNAAVDAACAVVTSGNLYRRIRALRRPTEGAQSFTPIIPGYYEELARQRAARPTEGSAT